MANDGGNKRKIANLWPKLRADAPRIRIARPGMRRNEITLHAWDCGVTTRIDVTRAAGRYKLNATIREKLRNAPMPPRDARRLAKLRLNNRKLARADPALPPGTDSEESIKLSPATHRVLFLLIYGRPIRNFPIQKFSRAPYVNYEFKTVLRNRGRLRRAKRSGSRNYARKTANRPSPARPGRQILSRKYHFCKIIA